MAARSGTGMGLEWTGIGIGIAQRTHGTFIQGSDGQSY